jgi:uncharacterized protein
MNMSKRLPLMPKATAVWLVDNTTLTFKQIADFCGMHELEVKGIADGEVARGVMGINPVSNGQLTKDELERCCKDSNASLRLSISQAYEAVVKNKKKETKYTPIARRQDKPDAILYMIKNYPEITDAQLVKLIGTTKSTVEAIRDRSHWNLQNIRPRDPVLLNLCTQIEFDRVIEKAKLENKVESEQE